MRRKAIAALLQLKEARIAPSQCSTSGRLAMFSSLGYEPETLLAEVRTDSGSRVAAGIRKSGRIPGALLALPGERDMLLTFDQANVATQVHRIGRTAFACRLFNLRIDSLGVEFPSLGRQVHMHPATDEIENVTLMHCPPDRRVRVKVPLQVFGEEVCPGLKAGGRINWIQRTIACIARGDSIPSGFEVDISELVIGNKLHYDALNIPEGVELAVKDPKLPILKIMRK